MSNVEFGQSLDIVMDLADAGSDLLDIDGGVVPGKPRLLVGHDDAQQGGDGHLATDLSKSKNK